MNHQLQIVTGKGGVGRSAVTAAIALAAARSGRRVLAAAAMTDCDRPRRCTLVSTGSTTCRFRSNRICMRWGSTVAGLSTSICDFSWVWANGCHCLPLSRNLEALSQTVPGIRDVVTTGKLYHEVRSGNWDLVIADGPPTGQIMSYLRASRVIASLVRTGRATGTGGRDDGSARGARLFAHHGHARRGATR